MKYHYIHPNTSFINLTSDTYTIQLIGGVYRIFVQTFQMKENSEPEQDAEQVFGSGPLWVDYPNFELCELAIMEEFVPYIEV